MQACRRLYTEKRIKMWSSGPKSMLQDRAVERGGYRVYSEHRADRTSTNNIDRPSTHSLPLAKLTNLSSEWKVSGFCRLKKICVVNELFLF